MSVAIAAPSEPAVASSVPPAEPHVLVVDDSRVVRAVICSTLRAARYHVQEAASGPEALLKLRAGAYDAVITDLKMPGLDGFAVLAEVKRTQPDVEVIVLTGTHAGDVTCAIRALRLGAHDYLGKPPGSPEEVLLTVERAVEKKRLKDANRRLIAELQAISRRDALTGLLNRRSFEEAFPAEVARARRHRRPLALVMVDVDHFKRINDTYGHQGGDAVLNGFGRRAFACLREEDAIYRYGGEEFAIVLPEADEAGALIAARRVVERVSSAPFALQAGPSIGVTVSAGVAALEPGMESASDLLARADQALYQAKSAGRNRALVLKGLRAWAGRAALAIGG